MKNNKFAQAFAMILLGLFLLFFIDQALLAGICLLIGIVMILERVWPEKWETNDN